MKSLVYAQVASEKLRDKPRRSFIQKLQQFIDRGKFDKVFWRETGMISSTEYSTAVKHELADNILTYAGGGEIHLLSNGNYLVPSLAQEQAFGSIKDAEDALYELTIKKAERYEKGSL